MFLVVLLFVTRFNPADTCPDNCHDICPFVNQAWNAEFLLEGGTQQWCEEVKTGACGLHDPRGRLQRSHYWWHSAQGAEKTANNVLEGECALESTRGVQRGDVIDPSLFAIAPQTVVIAAIKACWYFCWSLNAGWNWTLPSASYFGPGSDLNSLRRNPTPLPWRMNTLDETFSSSLADFSF